MNNTTASVDTTPNLTWDKLAEIWNAIRPPLHYATSTFIKQGQVALIKEPELLVCHPDDLDSLRERITHRRFVHMRDRPPEEFYQDFRATALANPRAFTT